MSLEKAIFHGKEHRKRHYGSKVFDWSCRNHGGCDYCKANRLYQSTKAEKAAEEQVEELEKFEKAGFIEEDFMEDYDVEEKKDDQGQQ